MHVYFSNTYKAAQGTHGLVDVDRLLTIDHSLTTQIYLLINLIWTLETIAIQLILCCTWISIMLTPTLRHAGRCHVLTATSRSIKPTVRSYGQVANLPNVFQQALHAVSPRTDWTREQISEIYNTPLMELAFASVCCSSSQPSPSPYPSPSSPVWWNQPLTLHRAPFTGDSTTHPTYRCAHL